VWRGTTSAVPCPRALRLSTSQDQAYSLPASPSHHATTPCTLPAQLKAHRAAPQLCVLNRRNFQLHTLHPVCHAALTRSAVMLKSIIHTKSGVRPR